MMFQSLILVFLIKIFGLYSGFRIVKKYFSEGILNKTSMTKIGSAYVVFMTITSLIKFPIWLMVVVVFSPILIFIVLIYVLYLKREKQFRSELPDFLSAVILGLKAGQSFRVSYKQSVLSLSIQFAQRMRLIYDHVTFSQHSSDKTMTPIALHLREIVEVLQEVNQSSSGAAERLEKFRNRLLIEEHFRRRSGQVRGQVVVQSFLMTFIYVGCLAFVLIYIKTDAYMLLFASSVLFLLGLVLIQIIGRKIQWKL